MGCLMIKTKTYGTDLIGITLWSAGSWMKSTEINTFLLDIHFTVDKGGQIKITVGTLNLIYFSFAIEVRSGA